MKTKMFLLGMLLFAAFLMPAQITPSMSIPNPIPNYDGTYDDFGQNHLFYPNGGEVRFASNRSTAIDIVKYYTMNTYPKKFLLNNNNISLCYSKPNTTTQKIDSLHRIDLEWTNSKSTAFLARVDTQLNARLHYFTNWFSSSGRTDVQGGAAIACQSIYQNIDLVYTSNNAGLVMYFIVYPGGNYKNIIMHINGSKANSIVSNKLKIQANWEFTTFEKPQMYQYTYVSNVVTPVTIANASWQTAGTDKYQFNTSSSFNTSLPLIIQVKQGVALQSAINGLDWSTYFGGSQFDFLTKTHCDATNNLYVAGYSNSNNFPQVAGVTGNLYQNGDAVIAKFSAAGVLQWSTYVGGSSEDHIRDFDFNSSSIYCVGKTSSNDLATVNKAGATNDATFGGPNWDGFIFEFSFNSSGQISNNWLRYFGGNGDEELNSCRFDGSGNFFVVGDGTSTDMTLVNPGGAYQQSFNASQISASIPLSTDGIIAKFNTTFSQTWFTFYGTDALGTNAHNNAGDYFYDITISGTDIYVCGKAGGTNLPNSLNSKFVSGNFDGILVHFTTSGVMNSNDAKFTNGNIVNYSVKTLWGDVYTVGQANSTLGTVNSGSYYFNNTFNNGTSSSTLLDGCFSVHSQNLATTIHNTFLGGSGDDAAYDLQIGPNNLFIIGGGTNSSDFPTNSLGTMYTKLAQGYNDNFITCFQKNNSNMVWGTYLGSPSMQESLTFPVYFNSAVYTANTTIAVNNQNYIYVLGNTTSFNDFPLDQWTGAPVYFQPQNASPATDATITRLDVSPLSTITGLKDFENTEFVFGVYPNPTTKSLVINNAAIVNDDLYYAIYDMSGKKLGDGRLKADDAKNIDVSLLPRGIYIVNVSNGKKTFSNKFVKVED